VSRDDADLQRELEKIRDVVEKVDQHFTHEAAMNAALHMSETIRPAPLAMAVSSAKADLDRLIIELIPVTRASPLLCTYKDRSTNALCGRPEDSEVHAGPDDRMGGGKHVYRND